MSLRILNVEGKTSVERVSLARNDGAVNIVMARRPMTVLAIPAPNASAPISGWPPAAMRSRTAAKKPITQSEPARKRKKPMIWLF